ncbi:MAG: PEGA domain-containing protein [Luteitalea sp.]|nr:PEGA domain-containing protein [Luteitalea sp.]
MRTRIFATAVVVAAILACGAGADAQVTTATVYGRVTDATGGVVPGANVTLTNETTAAAWTEVTSEEGEVTINFVPVGRYTLRVALEGFAEHVQDLELSAGQTVRLAISLAVGELTDAVNVTAATPLINRANAQLQDVVSDEQLVELPVGRRDWSQLLELDSSVVLDGEGAVMNGLPPSGLSLTIDGTNGSSDAEAPSIGAYQGFNTISGVSTEAIAEISVSSGIASAEFGGTMAGNVNIITRSGSNTFHGSLFENHQRDDLDAANPFVDQAPEKRFNQFGGSLGGPVVRNRLFFFGTYEGVRSDELALQRDNVPTPEWRAEALAANPVYESFFALFPDPTEPYDAGARTARFQALRPDSRDDDHVTARVDVTLSSANRFNVRYSGGRPARIDPRVIEANPRTFSGQQDSATMAFTHAATAWVFETRAGVNRSNIDRVDQLYTLGHPNVDVSGVDLSDGELFLKRGWLFSFDQVIATTRGRHSLKAGFGLVHQRAGRENFQVPGYEYSSIDDFYANIPNGGQFTFGLNDFRLTTSQLGGFVQDDIRLGSSLVVNAGLRYDYFTVPKERDGRLFNRDAPFGTGPLRSPDSLYAGDFNNVSPRVGVAWSIDAHSVLRGGVGLFVSPHPLFGGPVDVVLNAADEQFRVNTSRQDSLELGIRFPLANTDVEDLLQGPAQLWGTRSISPNFPNPYSTQWSAIFERQLGAQYSLEVGYTGSRGDNLNTVWEINRPDRLTGIRPYAGFAQFDWYDASNSSEYNGLQLSLRRRFANRLGFGASYTLSKSMSYGGGDLLLETQPQETFDLDAEWGPSDWDVRHRLVANFIYEVAPMGPSRLVRGLVGGWQVSGIFTARSGRPVDIIDDESAYGSSRPDYGGGDMVLSDWRDTLRYLNPAAFERVPLSGASGAQIRPGTLGWNAARGLAAYNLDLGLARNFHIGRYRLQVRADMFNALNTRNYGGLESEIDADDFGTLNSVSTRTMQVGARFSF